ncbi:MAG: Asp-tRNA(Asn)/Glu-tRNA(Gln) amidotransferase subunit GatA, partial [Desulfobacteraceae bacterium]|nr:Asp-tRNA(Asn)/Glu-tRNA(Gln) amidotransferase subunit GatA [Desulfobacteraceae bacterium]
MQLCDHSATKLARMLRKGEVSSRQITESVFQRMDEKEDAINAFITATPEIALRQADLADRRFRENKKISLLNGIPIAIKDNMCTRGVPTTCGSRILENYIPPYNGTAVAKVLQAGAVPIGKTNMDEFAMGSSCENSAFGPTYNPLNLERVAG